MCGSIVSTMFNSRAVNTLSSPAVDTVAVASSMPGPSSAPATKSSLRVQAFDNPEHVMVSEGEKEIFLTVSVANFNARM